MSDAPEAIDLAIVGAGVAGTYVGSMMSRSRPDWSIALFERTDRVGGRLRSVRIPGIDHPIELGGMRYLTTHPRVQGVVDDFGLATRTFTEGRGRDRFLLRDVMSGGPDDPAAGAGYDLIEADRDRSANDLAVEAFERIVPGATGLDPDGWRRVRATHVHQGRALTDWSMSDALASVLDAPTQRFVTDAFGYDAGLTGFNAGDSIDYMLGSGAPAGAARVPMDGMESIPRVMAADFEHHGGATRLGHELRRVEMQDGIQVLTFGNGACVRARRVVLALAAPALRILAADTPVLGTPRGAEVLGAVDTWQAAKLYLWYEAPWWRDGFDGARATTDRASRKTYYFDDFTPGPAALLATYTDGLHAEPWRALADGSPPGSPAPAPMLAEIERHLQAIHLSAVIPPPVGSAFIHWGADPHETGWHFWRAGARSDDVIDAAVQIDPNVSFYLCGEAFSRSQAWVEGALETGEEVVRRLTTGTPAPAGV